MIHGGCRRHCSTGEAQFSEVVHRDIKLTNILAYHSADGGGLRVRLSDFGPLRADREICLSLVCFTACTE